MQFKHPEILYALFLLVIPLIIHLFQLRKFKKEAFTNVKFLKKVVLQTRKSSQLKKWLVLLCRILALTALILAFAQPFIPHSTSALKEKETIIYLDNSFSMQQKSNQATLLQKATQQVLENLPETQKITVITNNTILRETSLTDLKKELLQLGFSSQETSLKTVYLQALTEFSKRKDTEKNFIAISDFQESTNPNLPEFNKNIQNHLIKLTGDENLNISIDSVAITSKELDNIELKVFLSTNKKNTKTFPVSLFNGTQLLAKSSAGFTNTTKASAVFTLPSNDIVNGKISVEDDALQYDNTFYVHLQPQKTITVVSISGTDDNFLTRIYKDKQLFHFINFSENQVDYNQLENANFIILNEINELPPGLTTILQAHLDHGGSVSIIPPSTTSALNQYNSLLHSLKLGQFTDQTAEELKVTSINFASPLYSNVFNNEVNNFQYPSVHQAYRYTGISTSLLNYNNGSPFLIEKNKRYVFSAAINKENSNFKNSPLIVPTFYNMALQSLPLPKLYYSIGKANTIAIPVEVENDDVLHLHNKEEDIIPLQQKFNTKIELTTDELPTVDGIFTVTQAQENLGTLAYNYSRKESLLNTIPLSDLKNVTVDQSIQSFFNKEANKNQVDLFWKWFIIFAVLFFIMELILLKFLK